MYLPNGRVYAAPPSKASGVLASGREETRLGSWKNAARNHLSTARIVSPLSGTFIPIESVCSSRLEKLVAAKLSIVSLPKLLGEPDEKSFGTADVAKPIRVLVLNHFTDELRAALEEPGERLVDVVHGEHDA